MAKQQQPLQLLILGCHKKFEAEICDVLANQYSSLQSHWVKNTASLSKTLPTKKWDIALCENNKSTTDTKLILKQIREHSSDSPIIVIGDVFHEETILQLFQAGAAGCIERRHIGTLRPILHRELSTARTRLMLEKTEEQLDRQSVELEVTSLEAKQAETDLKKEALRRQILMNASRDGIAIFNQEHQVVEANQRFAHMLGYTQEEANSLQTWDFETMMTEEEIRIAFADLTQTSATFETVHRKKDGTTYNAEVSASGALVGDEPMVFTVSRDITEKKKIQANLAQSDRLASMGMLAAGVAHEINNPLAYVLYHLETLSKEIPLVDEKLRDFRMQIHSLLQKNATEELRNDFYSRFSSINFDKINKRIREALDGTRRIQDIASSLSTFSRVERKQLIAVDVHYTIECAANMAFNELKYRAKFVKDFGNISTVMASEGHLSQVFLNLLINAVHAVEEGNVEGNEIRVRTWQENDTVCVEVRDTGKGITPKTLKRVFEPFFTTKKVGEGSGLGLSISQNIITGYGGKISVKSKVGDGTSFFIRIPIHSVKLDKQSSAEQQLQHSPSVSGRILVVDDEENILKVLQDMLCDCEVTATSCAKKAMTIVNNNPNFDMILCDLMMPEVTGMAFHQWIVQTHPSLANRLIFITGGAFTPNARNYISTVSNICINKPFNQEALLGQMAKMNSSAR